MQLSSRKFQQLLRVLKMSKTTLQAKREPNKCSDTVCRRTHFEQFRQWNVTRPYRKQRYKKWRKEKMDCGMNCFWIKPPRQECEEFQHRVSAGLGWRNKVGGQLLAFQWTHFYSHTTPNCLLMIKALRQRGLGFTSLTALSSQQTSAAAEDNCFHSDRDFLKATRYSLSWQALEWFVKRL